MIEVLSYLSCIIRVRGGKKWNSWMKLYSFYERKTQGAAFLVVAGSGSGGLYSAVRAALQREADT